MHVLCRQKKGSAGSAPLGRISDFLDPPACTAHPLLATLPQPASSMLRSRASPFGSSRRAVSAGATKTTFKVVKPVLWGESVAVVGSSAELGKWDPANPLALSWTAGDVWFGTAELPNE